jgi:hypothetical protein
MEYILNYKLYDYIYEKHMYKQLSIMVLLIKLYKNMQQINSSFECVCVCLFVCLFECMSVCL